MASFKSQEEGFEVDTLFDGEPVESEENRSDVFTRPGVCEKARSRVLDSIEGMRGDASEEGVAVIKMGQDEGVDKGFSSRGGQAVSDFGDAEEVVEEVLTMELTWGTKERVGSMIVWLNGSGQRLLPSVEFHRYSSPSGCWHFPPALFCMDTAAASRA